MITFRKSNSNRILQQKFICKKGNKYFVNIVNIENTVNTANNKNNILIYLTLPMDHSLPVESTPQIDLKTHGMKMQMKHQERVTQTIPNAASLIYSVFMITTILMKINTVAAQTTKVTLELMKVRLMRCFRKREKEKIIENGHRQNQNQN